MLQIAVINESTTISDNDVRVMIPAFAAQWNNELNDVWGVGAAQFSFVAKNAAPPAGSWWLVFLDNSKQAKDLAYHDLTDEGLPISNVFVKTILDDNSSVSVAATHELCEMAVDPWLNSAYQDAQGTFWAGEICDPVEDDQYGYEINGVLVTDFVTPDWFGLERPVGDFDFKARTYAVFEVMTGGYAQKWDPLKGWLQITGAKAKTSKKAQAQKGSRRERRKRQWQGWIPSKRFRTGDDGGVGGGRPK